MKLSPEQLNVVRIPQEMVEWAKRAYMFKALDPHEFLLNILRREMRADFVLESVIPDLSAGKDTLNAPIECYRMVMLLERIEEPVELVKVRHLKQTAA